MPGPTPCLCGDPACPSCFPGSYRWEQLADEVLAAGEIDPNDEDALIDAVEALQSRRETEAEDARESRRP